MCGIAGIFSPRGVDTASLQAMSAAIAHRGPNGYGTLLHSRERGTRIWHNVQTKDVVGAEFTAGLAFRRLSVIDSSNENMQPMMDQANTIGLAYNGEIYNYLELRKELETLGYTFRTSGDTEVLLNAYREWGIDCVRHFNGMWAFAILDTRNNSLILSRDRFGIKPLYYANRNEALYIASEIKGILAVPSLTFLPNEHTVADYLANGKIDANNHTFFEGIESFPAGCIAVIPLGPAQPVVRALPYWSFPTQPFRGSETEAIENFRGLLFDAVRLHGRSDKPIGTCLSGGMDSSSIVCVAQRLLNENTIPQDTREVFGYRSANKSYSEERYMRLVADAADVKMNLIDVTDEEFALRLPAIISSQDEPVGSASVAAQWFVFQECHRKGMTVMMDGQGADEILGGYPYYFATIAAGHLARFDIPGYYSLRKKYEDEIGPFPASIASLVLALLPGWIQRFVKKIYGSMAYSGAQRFAHNMLSSHLMSLANDLRRTCLPSHTILSKHLQQEVYSSSLPALLRYEDRNSMAHSVEARVPFLDTRLVDFAFSLPDHYKIRGLITKYILRQAMQGIVPDRIVERKDKIGFRADPGLMSRLLMNKSEEFIENRSHWERQWFTKRGVEQVFNNCAGSTSAEFLAWRVLNVKLWTRQFWP